jgi:hypothetical protein
LVAHVGTENRDPVQARRAQSSARAIGMSDRDAHRRSLFSEALHDAPTEETGTPEDTDRGHGDRRRSLLRILVCIDNFVEHATRDC